jgi:hypothetical protein
MARIKMFVTLPVGLYVSTKFLDENFLKFSKRRGGPFRKISILASTPLNLNKVKSREEEIPL